jgi:hypothetical protein
MQQKYRQNGMNVIEIKIIITNMLHKTGILEECSHCNVQKNHTIIQTKEYNNDSIIFKCVAKKNKGTNAINIKKKKESQINGTAKSKPFILETSSNKNTLYALTIFLVNIDTLP